MVRGAPWDIADFLKLKEYECPLEAGKGQEMDFFTELLERNAAQQAS